MVIYLTKHLLIDPSDRVWNVKKCWLSTAEVSGVLNSKDTENQGEGNTAASSDSWPRIKNTTLYSLFTDRTDRS